ncbi:MAG: ATP-binding protein [Clostridia bacterium]|nr:ATP-binding protein [Clostridia bacterium]
MKKAILLRLFIVSAVAALICSAASVLIEQRSYESEVRGYLYNTVDAICKTADLNTDKNALAKQLASLYSLDRVTIIRSDGVVLGDSVADFRTMENHSSRPEVAGALSSGRGDSIRHSETVGQDMLYVACRASDGTVFRASMYIRNINSRVLTTLPVTLGAIAFALLIAVLLAGGFSKSLLRPVRRVMDGISDIEKGNYGRSLEPVAYEELTPLVGSVNKLSGAIRATISELRAEHDKLEFIFDSIAQGILIVEHDTRVAHVNKAACLYLTGAERKDGETLFDYARSSKITGAVETCLRDGASSVFDYENEQTGQIFGISVSPVDGEWIQNGAIVIVTDLTQERRSQQLRREFIANASHELKTPVTSIRGFAELISSGIVNDSAQIADYIVRIKSEADRMSGLISDILMLSSLEENGGRNAMERVDLLAAAHEVVESLMPLAASSGVALSLEGTGGHVSAEPENIRRLLVNLVENAVKYNVRGGSVWVSITTQRGFCILSVKDTGIGIPPKSVPRIFERFYRADPGRSRQTGGTGLGLAIVKHIVSQLGGEIAVRSTQGAGTEFIVRLPASR